MKNKTMLAKGLILLGLVLIIAGGALFVTDKDKYFKDEKKSEEKTPTEEPKEASGGNLEGNYSGIYEKDGIMVKLFEMNNDVFFDIQSDEVSLSSKGELQNKQVEVDLFGTITIKFEDNKLVISYEADDKIAGEYSKRDEYTKEDFYMENYGDAQFLNGKYNAEYQKDTATVKMYQVNENTVYVEITDSNMDSMVSYAADFTLEGENTLKSELFDSNVTITLVDEKITVEAASTDENSNIAQINGEYEKTKNLTIDDIITEIER